MATVNRKLIALLLSLLAACGGGDPEPEAEEAPLKPLCKIDPTKQCPFAPSTTP